MRAALFLVLVSTASIASAAGPGQIPATGLIYLTYDIGMGNQTEGQLTARFVPDTASRARFPAVTTGVYTGQVRYITLEPSEQLIRAAIGQAEADRLGHNWKRIIRAPVTLVATEYKSVVECDSRTYRATLMSIKLTGKTKVANRDSAPIGC